MEYKVDLERAVVKPSASKCYQTAIYSLIALSSIVLGALAMALLYHWNELQVIDKRLKAHDVKEVIRLKDALLTKHETNAANVAKLLFRFEHKLQSIESKLQAKMAATDSESNSNSDEDENSNHNQQGNKHMEKPGLAGTVPSNEVKMRGSNTVENMAKASIDTQTASSSSSEETKQSESASHDEKQSVESFRWEMSLPQSAWLKLSTSGINYGTSSDHEAVSE